MSQDDELILVVEELEEAKAFRLTVTTQTGRRISMEEFLMEIEAYAKEVLRADELKQQPGTSIH